MKSKLAIFGGRPLIKFLPPYKSPIGRDEFNEVFNRMVRKNSEVPSNPFGSSSIKEFEIKFAKYIGSKYAITTTSGTTALHLALESLNLPKNSEVLVPAMSFIATANAVLHARLKVKFVDIDKNFCLDPKDLKIKINKKVSAVILVHLYGHPANMDEILLVTKQMNIPVIEDACQSHGAEYHGKKTGNIGDIGCFSFFTSKNMTTGEGGMIVTSNKKIYLSLLSLRSHGNPNNENLPYIYNGMGYNYSMTTMQGIIGIVQLNKLRMLNEYRKQMFELYLSSFSGLPIILPTVEQNIKSAYHLFPILIPEKLINKRDEIVDALRAEGVPLSVAYPAPMYMAPQFFKKNNFWSCPNAENVSSRIITFFTDNNIKKNIVPKIKNALDKVLNYYLNEDFK
ncbi:MAG: DegT/DnrJ/EryC1/StrS family aminotransferase [bacterium]|nr:DegT/DnrJ/EryC1/StrS family aminotransferase [bacterium]